MLILEPEGGEKNIINEFLISIRKVVIMGVLKEAIRKVTDELIRAGCIHKGMPGEYLPLQFAAEVDDPATIHVFFFSKDGCRYLQFMKKMVPDISLVLDMPVRKDLDILPDMVFKVIVTDKTTELDKSKVAVTINVDGDVVEYLLYNPQLSNLPVNKEYKTRHEFLKRFEPATHLKLKFS